MPTLPLAIDATRAESGARAFQNSLQRVDRQTRNTARNTEKITRSTDRLGRSFRLLTRVAGALGAALSIRELIRLSDAFTQVNNRLRLVTNSTEELLGVQAELIRQSKENFVAFDAQAEVFQRVARGAGAIGLSTRDALKATEAVAAAVRLSGVSAESAQAALVQFGQGLAAGALRGDELRSVLEQTPRLAQAVADSLGVAVGELRALAEAGGTTAEKILPGLIEQLDTLKAETDLLTPTVAEAFTNLGTAATVAAGDLSGVTGASAGFGEVIQVVADIIEGPLVNAAVEFSQQLSAMFDLAREVGSGVTFVADQIADAFTDAIPSAEGLGDVFIVLIRDTIPNLIALVRLFAVNLDFVSDKIAGFISDVVTTGEFLQANAELADAQLAGDEAGINKAEAAIRRTVIQQELMNEQLEKSADLRDQAINDILKERTLRIEARDAAQKELEQRRARREQALKELADLTSGRAGGFDEDADTGADKLSKEILKLRDQTRTPFEEFLADFKVLQDAVDKGLPTENFRTGVENLINDLAGTDIPLSEFAEALQAAVSGPGLDAADIDFLGEFGLSLEELQGKFDDFRDVFGDVPVEDFFEALEAGKDITEEVRTPLEEFNDEVDRTRLLMDAGIISEETFDKNLADLKDNLLGLTDVLEEFGKQAARNTQDAFAEFLFDPFDSDLEGLVSNFAEAMRKIAAEALASAVLKQIFGAASGAFPGIASLFGGGATGRAEGGPLARGQPAIVGEREPELFVPQQAGTVLNGAQMAAMAPNITNVVVLNPRDMTAALSTPQGSQDLINAISINSKKIKAQLQ